MREKDTASHDYNLLFIHLFTKDILEHLEDVGLDEDG